MCGRFTQKLTWREAHDLYGLLTNVPPDNMRPRWNGAPTQDFAACRLDADGARTASRLRWGLIPFWAKDMKIGSRLINARAETVDSKPAFRSAFKSRRCLVPADGWFEWVREGGAKSPRFISMSDGSIASFAALWERWDRKGEAVESFTIITTEAAPDSRASMRGSPRSSIQADLATGWTPMRPRQRCSASFGRRTPAPTRSGR